jgi:uncharacterized repeat protein (TIGR03943 family)
MTRVTATGCRVVALGAWAAFFTWLWIGGSARDFVGARTSWVVPFGAIVLALATLALLVGSRRQLSRAATLRECVAVMLILSPVLAVVAAPGATLGAYAVARKGSARAVAALALPVPHGPEQPPNLFDVVVAGQRPEVARQLGIAEGREVRLTGLVSRMQGGSIGLSRLITNCCAADALAYTVPVDAEGQVAADDPYPLDTWLAVTGTLRRGADGFTVEATAIEEIDAPDNPYAAGT